MSGLHDCMPDLTPEYYEKFKYYDSIANFKYYDNRQYLFILGVKIVSTNEEANLVARENAGP
jgi:hypothetical protein